ncbi:MAG TPA: hypothetical protein V6D29_20110 [Leptolyngbyaceae cyanobacterium]
MEQEFKFIAGCSESFRRLLHHYSLSICWDEDRRVMVIECGSILQERAFEVMQGASKLPFVTVIRRGV